MSYRVQSYGQMTPAWAGGSALASNTAVLLRTAGVIASEIPGSVSASVSGNNWTYKDSAGNTLGTVSIAQAQTTLASVIPGATVWISTGIGAGWTRGLVVSDGSVVQYGPPGTPTLAVGTTAYTGLVTGGGGPFPQPAASPAAALSNPSTTMQLVGTASDNTPYFQDGYGNSFSASNSATTVGALTPGTPALVAVGNRWAYMTV